MSHENTGIGFSNRSAFESFIEASHLPVNDHICDLQGPVQGEVFEVANSRQSGVKLPGCEAWSRSQFKMHLIQGLPLRLVDGHCVGGQHRELCKVADDV